MPHSWIEVIFLVMGIIGALVLFRVVKINERLGD